MFDQGFRVIFVAQPPNQDPTTIALDFYKVLLIGVGVPKPGSYYHGSNGTVTLGVCEEAPVPLLVLKEAA